MSSSSNGSYFLTFHDKKYDTTFDWLDENGILQDPKTHASYSHMDIKVSFSLGLFAWKNVVSCFIENLTVRHCHFVVCSCWKLGYCMIDHVVMLVLEHFWSVHFFLSWCVTWTMLVAYGILTMLVVCDVVGWILAWILGALALWKICVVGLYEYAHDVCGKVCRHV